MKEAKVYTVKHPRYRFMVFFRRKGFDTYRRYFNDESDASEDCEAFNRKLFSEGREGIQIGPREREQIKTAIHLLEGTGISIVRAAEIALEQLNASGSGKEMYVAIFEFLEAKERQGRAERTRYNLENRLKHFSERGEIKTLQGFSPETCSGFIYRGEPNQQRNNYAALNNFANFCVRRGYIPSNPLLRIEKPGAPRREEKATLSANESEAFLRDLELKFPQYVSFYAVLLFAFLRPSEAESL